MGDKTPKISTSPDKKSPLEKSGDTSPIGSSNPLDHAALAYKLAHEKKRQEQESKSSSSHDDSFQQEKAYSGSQENEQKEGVSFFHDEKAMARSFASAFQVKHPKKIIHESKVAEFSQKGAETNDLSTLTQQLEESLSRLSINQENATVWQSSDLSSDRQPGTRESIASFNTVQTTSTFRTLLERGQELPTTFSQSARSHTRKIFTTAIESLYSGMKGSGEGNSQLSSLEHHSPFVLDAVQSILKGVQNEARKLSNQLPQDLRQEFQAQLDGLVTGDGDKDKFFTPKAMAERVGKTIENVIDKLPEDQGELRTKFIDLLSHLGRGQKYELKNNDNIGNTQENKKGKKLKRKDISEAYALASKNKNSSSDLHQLVNRLKPIRMWVRANQERLSEIGHTIDEFERIAAEAKKHKENVNPSLRSSGGFAFNLLDLSKKEQSVNLYKEAVEKELEIAGKLHDHLGKDQKQEKKNKDISKDDINKVLVLASESKTTINSLYNLANKFRPIRMWVRANQERLGEIGHTIGEFEDIAAEAKDHKGRLIVSAHQYGVVYSPQSPEIIESYKEVLKKELAIASKLHDHLHGISPSS